MSASTEYANRVSNQVRQERARIKTALRLRSMTLEQARQEPAVQTMQIARLLECVPGMSLMKVGRLLLRVQITYCKEVERITQRQWDLIDSELIKGGGR